MQIKVHSTETMGALDGPGLRTIFFLSGCTLKCRYCHNVDMLNFNAGEAKSIQELVENAKKYTMFYGDDGGVTLSGGEPLAQGVGVIELAKALKKENIHTVLDTSGTPFNPDAIDAVDMVILDIKHTDAVSYQDLAGIKIDGMLKTLEYLKQTNKRFWVRQVILQGITDSEQQIKTLKQMAQGAEKIELLAYHKMGVVKYKAAGLQYTLDHIPPTDKATMDRVNGYL